MIVCDIFPLFAGKLPITVYAADYINEVSMSDMSFAPHDKSPGSFGKRAVR